MYCTHAIIAKDVHQSLKNQLTGNFYLVHAYVFIMLRSQAAYASKLHVLTHKPQCTMTYIYIYIYSGGKSTSETVWTG